MSSHNWIVKKPPNNKMKFLFKGIYRVKNICSKIKKNHFKNPLSKLFFILHLQKNEK